MKFRYKNIVICSLMILLLIFSLWSFNEVRKFRVNIGAKYYYLIKHLSFEVKGLKKLIEKDEDITKERLYRISGQYDTYMFQISMTNLNLYNDNFRYIRDNVIKLANTQSSKQKEEIKEGLVKTIDKLEYTFDMLRKLCGEKGNNKSYLNWYKEVNNIQLLNKVKKYLIID